jgi:hypothetical protein
MPSAEMLSVMAFEENSVMVPVAVSVPLTTRVETIMERLVEVVFNVLINEDLASTVATPYDAEREASTFKDFANFGGSRCILDVRCNQVSGACGGAFHTSER